MELKCLLMKLMAYSVISKLIAFAEVPYPITVVMMVIPFFLGGLIAGLVPSLSFFLICFLLMFSYIGGFNTLNAISDLKLDLISKPHRPLPSKRLTLVEAKIYSVFLFIIFLGISVIIFSTEIFVLNVLFVLFAYLYSNIIHLKKIPFAANIFLGIVYTYFPLLLGWYLVKGDLNVPIIEFSLIFIFTTIVLFCKDFEDYVADKKYGVKTFVNIFGLKKALFFVSIAFLLFFIFFSFLFLGQVLFIQYVVFLSLVSTVFLTVLNFNLNLQISMSFTFFKLLTLQVIVFQVIVTLISIL